LADRLARAPMIDLLIASLTWLPWLVAWIFAGPIGMLGALLAQLAALLLWTTVHELIHRRHARGPRIVKFVNRLVGRWRNYLALSLTLIALPGFWFIRILEILAYWPLVVLLDFPKYRQSE